MGSFVKVFGGLLAITLAIFLLSHLLGSYTVTSENMTPELLTGEDVLVSKLAYSFGQPDRGDIILLKSSEIGFSQIKRVIGLPGDIIKIENNDVYLNGIKLIEPYVKFRSGYTLPSYQIPADNYFILPDNRAHNTELSVAEMVSREDILGRAWLVAWPPDRWGGVNHYSLNLQLISDP
jgi:signal peptidase I